MRPIVVHKYGGSVLRGEAALRDVVADIARTVAAGRAVVAVVSAFEGTTDAILSRARRVTAKPARDDEALDLVLATGEMESAALLTIALIDAGVPARVLNPFQIGIETDGVHGDAGVKRLDATTLLARLAAGPAVVVPGFLGRGPNGALTTLGRGGSDLSAVAIASALRAESCDLVKDVPGYFSADPARVADARHRPEVTLADALLLSRHGNDLLQDRALEWASRGDVRIVVRSLGGDPRRTEIVRDAAEPRPPVVSIAAAPGASSLVLTLVGADPPDESGVRAALAGAGLPPPLAFASRGGSAMVAVREGDGERALAALHERFVVADVAVPGAS